MSARVADTNVVSLFLKETEDSRALAYGALLAGHEVVISFVTVAELFAWAKLKTWGPERRRKLSEIIELFVIDFASPAHCQIWADIRAETKRLGRPMSGEDIWIATTAILGGVPLITDNVRDFEHLRGFANFELVTVATL